MKISFPRFYRDWLEVIGKADVSGLQPKYFRSAEQFARFQKLSLAMEKMSPQARGLDLGCGPGFPLLLARQVEIKMSGQDVPASFVASIAPELQDEPAKTENDLMPRAVRGLYESFYSVQQALQGMGFDIQHFDMSHFPWPYADASFDFISASWSITKDAIQWVSEGKQDEDRWLPLRLQEIARILRPGGTLFVQGGATGNSHYDRVKKHGAALLKNRISLQEF